MAWGEKKHGGDQTAELKMSWNTSCDQPVCWLHAGLNVTFTLGEHPPLETVVEILSRNVGWCFRDDPGFFFFFGLCDSDQLFETGASSHWQLLASATWTCCKWHLLASQWLSGELEVGHLVKNKHNQPKVPEPIGALSVFIVPLTKLLGTWRIEGRHVKGHHLRPEHR